MNGPLRATTTTRCFVHGLGTALPTAALPQELSAAWAQRVSGRNGRARLIPALFRRAGIRTRHSVVVEGSPPQQSFFPPARNRRDGGPGTRARMERYAAESLPLALRAARAALRGTAPPTHLVTVSCSGFAAPGFDIGLMRELSLPAATARTHVGFMGCHGALNALRVAHAYVRAEPSARVLVCAVELCSLHYDYGADAGSIVANALFADGAAAMVVAGTPEGAAAEPPWTLAASGSCLVPDSHDLMTWSIGDHGFEMRLSGRVPDAIETHLRPWLAGWLAGHGLGLEQIGSWAVHPGGPRILSAVERALSLPDRAVADSRAVLAAYGNMSSPTVLFILERLRRRGAPRPCVALGFGPGLAVEAALFR